MPREKKIQIKFYNVDFSHGDSLLKKKIFCFYEFDKNIEKYNTFPGIQIE